MLQGLDVGSLAVAMAAVPAELSAGRALGRLSQDHPGLDYRATLTDWSGVADLVLSREADIGIGEVSVAKQNDRLKVEVVGEHEIVLFHRKGHPLSGKKQVSTAAINKFDLALMKLPGRLAQRFPGRGSVDPRTGYKIPAVEVADFAIARNVVLESDSVSASMILQIATQLESGDFEVLPFRAPWLKTNYGFIYRRDRMLSPAAKAFMGHVRHVELDVAAQNHALMMRYMGRE
jgi:DNA-binding transcriptional LysR family regulator